MMDLFDMPPVEGLAYRADLIDAGEEARLIAHCAALDLAPFRFQGWEGKRLTQSFGWRYDFDDRSFAPTTAIPDWLLPLRDAAAAFAGLDPAAFVQALVVRYDPGAGIGWHRDRPVFDKVIGVSLETPAVLRLRRRRVSGGFDRASLTLEPRSVYALDGTARRDWEHSIVPGEKRRFSITFRSLA
jgi:alkylated DNA repair protein (DNA oxidative demethylase)